MKQINHNSYPYYPGMMNVIKFRDNYSSSLKVISSGVHHKPETVKMKKDKEQPK